MEERRQEQETSEARPLEKLLLVGGTKQTKERKLALLECSGSFRTILLLNSHINPWKHFHFKDEETEVREIRPLFQGQLMVTELSFIWTLAFLTFSIRLAQEV